MRNGSYSHAATRSQRRLASAACFVLACRPAGGGEGSDSDGIDSGIETTSFVTGGSGGSSKEACESTPSLMDSDWCVSGAGSSLCYSRRWETVLSAFADQLHVGDVNGDGIGDVVVLPHTPFRIRQFLGASDCVFSERPDISLDNRVSEPGLSSSSELLADLDSDGADEFLVVFGDDPHPLFVLAGSVEGLTAEGQFAFDGWLNLAVGDVDGDGDPDLVYNTAGSPDRIAVHFGDGQRGLTSPQIAQDIPYDGVPGTESYSALHFDLVDFDEDGLADVNVGLHHQDLLGSIGFEGRVMFGDGDGRFSQHVAYPIAEQGNYFMRNMTVSGDFDGDGHPDFLVEGFVYLGNGSGGFKSTVPFDFATSTYEVEPIVGDLNGDGFDDVMLYDRWHLGSPDGLGPPLAVPPHEYRRMGDVNGDGVTDIIELGDAAQSTKLVVHFGASPAFGDPP